MTANIDVTVITASFNLIKNNRKNKIINCIETVHQQEGVNLEHIIIDGASTDGTLDLLKPYEEKGWLKIYSEPDAGIYDAFNKGILKAHGEYVCFINSDDFFYNNKGLAEAVRILHKSQADFSYSPVSYEKGGKIVSNDSKTLDFRTVFCAMPCSHQGMLFKRSLYDRIGLHNPKFIICADYDFILRSILNKATFVKVPVDYAGFSLDGLSGSHFDQLNSESIAIKQERYGCSLEQVLQIHNKRQMPLILLMRLLFKASIPDKHRYLFYWKNYAYFKTFRRWLFTLRTRKGMRCLRIIGITLINEEKQ